MNAREDWSEKTPCTAEKATKRTTETGAQGEIPPTLHTAEKVTKAMTGIRAQGGIRLDKVDLPTTTKSTVHSTAHLSEGKILLVAIWMP